MPFLDLESETWGKLRKAFQAGPPLTDKDLEKEVHTVYKRSLEECCWEYWVMYEDESELEFKDKLKKTKKEKLVEALIPMFKSWDDGAWDVAEKKSKDASEAGDWEGSVGPQLPMGSPHSLLGGLPPPVHVGGYGSVQGSTVLSSSPGQGSGRKSKKRSRPSKGKSRAAAKEQQGEESTSITDSNESSSSSSDTEVKEKKKKKKPCGAEVTLNKCVMCEVHGESSETRATAEAGALVK